MLLLISAGNYENHPDLDNTMLCSADEAQLMRLLIQLIQSKKVLEIGVYTGYSSLSMAMSLPTDGKLWHAGVESKIDLRLQSASTTLDELLAAGEAESFDLVFLDAIKPSYDQYYEKSLRLIRKGGLIVIDNVLWSSRVCDPDKEFQMKVQKHFIT
ncbi:Catechol O-methyltransferase domain-containing protein 1 [Desmophyllum pertusum]|uniref:Catechol O-methyltransferase domain-containing protein 1 n=1 Tax=Desmophyllum pertusum TaxID=174260 RepID=A0A9X0D940_9CNID|nr:Catechol O-methyltransferase domain-containing protein 1 [Desmophyllum pertusum]